MRARLACVLMLTGCVSAPAAYEPLVCDPANADHIAFAVQESGAFFGPETNKVYGNHFLIVDGACRFYRSSGLDARTGVVGTGTLTADQVAAINGELMTAPWQAIDGEHRFDMMGADASSISLWRDDLGASCYQSCSQGTPALQSILATAMAWESELAASATPMDGPVHLFVQGGYESADATSWDGASSISAAVPGSIGDLLVTDPDDAALLRTIRASGTSYHGTVLLREGDRYFEVSIVDAMPHVNEEGLLRPPFPLHT